MPSLAPNLCFQSDALRQQDILRISELADRIACKMEAVVSLTLEEKQAILWASILLQGANVRYQVVERPEIIQTWDLHK